MFGGGWWFSRFYDCEFVVCVCLLFVFGDCWWFPRSMMLVCGGFPALSSQEA